MKKLIILSLFLVGCTSHGIFTDPDGNQYTVSVNGNAETKLKAKANGDLEMSIKRTPLIKTPEIGDLRIGNQYD